MPPKHHRHGRSRSPGSPGSPGRRHHSPGSPRHHSPGSPRHHRGGSLNSFSTPGEAIWDLGRRVRGSLPSIGPGAFYKGATVLGAAAALGYAATRPFSAPGETKSTTPGAGSTPPMSQQQSTPLSSNSSSSSPYQLPRTQYQAPHQSDTPPGGYHQPLQAVKIKCPCNYVISAAPGTSRGTAFECPKCKRVVYSE